jgi:Na+/H+-translocating membrane pyrophosphatase
MQNPVAMLLFLLFGIILLITYVAIRRRWASPILVAAFGILGSVIVMTLTGLAQNTTLYQALFTGLVVGGLFSIGILAMAWYFSSNERRQQAGRFPSDDA